MDGKLPERVDALRLAQGAGKLAGSIPAAALTRLRALGELAGAVPATVSFGFDADGKPVVRGEANAAWDTTCQRCLGRMTIPVTCRFEQPLDEVLEPVGAGGTVAMLNLIELIEDELILAAPMIPLHPSGTCRAPGENDETPASAPSKRQPFAELARLRKQQD